MLLVLPADPAAPANQALWVPDPRICWLPYLHSRYACTWHYPREHMEAHGSDIGCPWRGYLCFTGGDLLLCAGCQMIQAHLEPGASEAATLCISLSIFFIYLFEKQVLRREQAPEGHTCPLLARSCARRGLC